MTEQWSLYDNPVFIEWQAEAIRMVMAAQHAENTVAIIDGREPRRAEINVVSLEEIRVVLVEQSPRMAGEGE